MASRHIVFPPYALDLEEKVLRRDGTPVPLRPRTFDVLAHLAAHPLRLIAKNELIDAVWTDAVVTEHLLAVCVSELRTALGDTAKKPRFIETVHRRGYRFIAELTAAGDSSRGRIEQRDREPPSDSEDDVVDDPLVGRDPELQQLQACLQRAARGQRQIVFVTGEPGIGKTALADAFRRAQQRESTAAPVWIADGQCVESYGAGEPYLPVLEALGRLAAQRQDFLGLLREHAPSWLLQLPALLSAAERHALQQQYAGVTRERMLRELVVGVEAVTAQHSLLLVFEDLQWSDISTVELLTALGQRRQPARLLILGTYRAVDVSLSGHHLRAGKLEL